MAVSSGYIKLDFTRLTPEEQLNQVSDYTATMEQRRSVRSFSNRPVPEAVIEKVIHSAGTSPSGANQQPWTYVLIQDPEVKRAIREAAELEEQQRLENIGIDQTDMLNMTGNKDYLEEAPYLVALFKINYGLTTDGTEQKIKHYYVQESAHISAGFFLAALQHAGLDSLVHAPVLAAQDILGRPKNESPSLLFAVGYAKDDYQAPSLKRRPLSEIVNTPSPFSTEILQAPEYLPRPKMEEQQQVAKANTYYEHIRRRRNVRHYSTEEVDIQLLHYAIRAAATTPSGGNLQPYRFAIVSDMETKQKIRELAEIEEKKLYEQRISEEWRDTLAPLGTNWKKPHLTDAPHLIVAFKVDENPNEANVLDQSLLYPKNNFAMESAAMAVGVLMGGLHHAGLCTLTHTPSPMTFLRDLLHRPKNEVPFVLLPVGYPAPDCEVPDITKKPLSEILVKF
ncbi:nitroreductase family protein [Ammoniphilus sp. CFH 90114]|uniref:nitroreductase family protein n=1 Tax=Ammoniphilus sp. CFH 90114 TaxID=2493665 RepID=UPI0013E97D65|nr:nitroreductase family protein [Ammoniphilus sp. CFH 90114]